MKLVVLPDAVYRRLVVATDGLTDAIITSTSYHHAMVTAIEQTGDPDALNDLDIELEDLDLDLGPHSVDLWVDFLRPSAIPLIKVIAERTGADARAIRERMEDAQDSLWAAEPTM